MSAVEKVNRLCGLELCMAVKRRKADGQIIVIANGKNRTHEQYNRLVAATREVLGSAIVRWNGQEREV